MHRAILAAAALTAVSGFTPVLAAEVRQADAVVELFTSQGCSSCPAADNLLSRIGAEGKVLTLAWHVDYWDYLGWKDTFALHANTDRQKGYAVSFGERQIYTPQAVINGRMHVVGSREEAVRNALNEFSGNANGLTVPIEAVEQENALKIKVPVTPDAKGSTLWMIYFNEGAEVDVARGENSGHKLKYTHMVRAVEMIGMVKDGEIRTEFMINDLARRGYDSCALVLQKTTPAGTPGPIIGAAFVSKLKG
ncbi:MAG: DUF1223 domain-containing protein [Nitratireductor sp.]